ncbi:MAG: flagellar hook-basal body complex protein FliE [Vannielia sp.]|uniref:flagellar hook-basal body complex protein FliE n=1 Tax=Rhodobacterales TaxID=204455 RepID=UPI0020956957|nr:flagellar hook-basal body complex protein FliE [Oceanicola sp. 502str15]MCO6384767.1 flagellar hook-basal body complex protein FliE [Oceanicola sp. 502str15]
MDIKMSSVSRLYEGARPATAPKTGTEPGGEGFARVAQDFAAMLSNAEHVAKEAMVGKADPHALVQALAETQLAVETAVTVRDKVVEAYQEILRMPV